MTNTNRTRSPGRGRRRRAGGSEAAARERILEAALEVFAAQGFEGARTREIAARAGANLGLLTYYFGDKLGLWRAAVASAFAELGRELAPDGETAPGDERARLEQLLRRFVHYVARRPAFMRLMNDEGKCDGPRMRWLVDHHVRPLAEALQRLVEAAQARSQLAPIPPVSAHYIALGAAGLLFSQAPECRYLNGVDPSREDFAEAHADAVVRLLLGPSEPPRASAPAHPPRRRSASRRAR